MKTLVSALCMMVSAAAFAAANNTVVSFSTPGPDTYKDGTPVLDGECYALVWSAGAFAGLAANGEAINPADKVLVTAPIAKGGRCPQVVFQLDADYVAANCAGGAFSIYLLDTRIERNGKLVVGGINALGKAVTVNAASAAGGLVASGSIGSAAADGALAAVDEAALPADAPTPKVEAIEVKGGNVYVTVSGAAPYLQFNLAGGERPDAVTDKVATPTLGSADGKIILVAPANKSGVGFLKVIRN